MNNLCVILFGTIALSLALPALAEPSRQLAQAEKSAPASNCTSKRLVLQLDHGPRAQTTPWMNERLRKRFEAEQKACAEAAAKVGAVQSSAA